MSVNTGRKPRHNPAGQHVHECALCGVTFRDNRQSTRYCCFEHKRDANNGTFYAAHKKEIILAVMLRQVRGTKSTRKRTAKVASEVPEVEAMTQEELLAFVRDNPQAIRVKRR